MAKKGYRMTPRRRAALKKAQMASARKRRGSRVGSALKTTAAVAGYVGATFAAYHTNRYIMHPDQFVKESRAGARAVGRVGKSGFKKVSGRKAPSKGGIKPKHQGTPNHIGYL